MFASIKHAAVVVALVSLCIVSADAIYYNTRYMLTSWSSCNTGTTYVGYDNAGYLRLRSSYSPYPSNIHCTVTLDAGSGSRIFVQFDSIDMSTGDSLVMYSGMNTSGRYLGTVTGTYTTFKTRTDSRYLTLKFDSYAINYSYTGFKIIYTIFQSEPCNGNFDFECDNDYCISDVLTCDQIDNCGDDSDEGSDGDCSGSESANDIGGVVVVIVVALIVVAIIVTAVTCCCICSYRIRHPRYQAIVHTDARAGTPVPGPGPAPYTAISYGSTENHTVPAVAAAPPVYTSHQQYQWDEGHTARKTSPPPPPPPYQQGDDKQQIY